MAQKVNDIYSNIIQINNSYPELADIVNTNTSDMSLLQTIYYIIATQLGVEQQYFDAFMVDLQTIAKNAPVGSAAWWQDKVLNMFQYSTDPDYGVVRVEAPYFIPQYTTVDTALNIVKYCSIYQNDANRQVTIKVAKEDNGPVQLAEEELLALKSFVNALQSAGLLISTVSFPADSIKLNIEIYYNAQYIESTVLANVKTAISEYLLNLSFDGSIYNSKLEDVIQAIEGVTDVYLIESQGKTYNGGYIEYKRKYNSQAGYCNLDLTNSTFTMLNKA